MSEKILKEQPVDTNLENAIDNNDLLVKTEEHFSEVEEKSIEEIFPEVIEVLDDVGLDHEQKDRIVRAMSLSEHHSGPIPHPRILRGYEEITPGAADRILTMAEKEAQHRHSMDDVCVRADSRDSLLGIISAFILGTLCIVGGIVVIIIVPENEGILSGTLITGSGLAGILGTFIRGTTATWKMNKKE